jgi:hypothetical protein
MSVFGLSPLGTDLGPLGGPGLITVLGVLPSTNNSCIVVFDHVPDTTDPLVYYSATNPDNYTLVTVDPTYLSVSGPIVPHGLVAPTRLPSVAVVEQDDDDPKQIELFSDAKLEPGVQYVVQVSPRIVGGDCETFAGEHAWPFNALALPGVLQPYERVQERYRDLAFAFGTGEGAYGFDESGDIAIQSAADSLKKRIYRRFFTKDGDFAWTTNYGVGASMKSLVKGNRLQTLSDAVREQVLREPDVSDAAAAVSFARAPSGAFVDVRVVARLSNQQLVNFQILEPL